MSAPPRHRLWTALAGPALAWFVSQQLGGQMARLACHAAGSALGPLASALALVVCAVAAALAWPFASAAGEDRRARADAFLAGLALGGAAVFALAIVFQSLATLIVPSCAR